MTLSGILYGYLPFEGVMEIQTNPPLVVQTFTVAGEVKENLAEKPDCYAYLIGKPILAEYRNRKIVELRKAPKP